jgi:hypothetical protein
VAGAGRIRKIFNTEATENTESTEKKKRGSGKRKKAAAKLPRSKEGRAKTCPYIEESRKNQEKANGSIPD